MSGSSRDIHRFSALNCLQTLIIDYLRSSLNAGSNDSSEDNRSYDSSEDNRSYDNSEDDRSFDNSEDDSSNDSFEDDGPIERSKYDRGKDCEMMCHQSVLELMKFKNLRYFQNVAICPNAGTKTLFGKTSDARVWILKNQVYVKKNVTFEEMENAFKLFVHSKHSYIPTKPVDPVVKRMSNFCNV